MRHKLLCDMSNESLSYFLFIYACYFVDKIKAKKYKGKRLISCLLTRGGGGDLIPTMPDVCVEK